MAGVEPGVVTPEAVRLEFENAHLGSRTLALLVDFVIQGLILLVVLVAGTALMSGVFFFLPEWVGVTMVLVLVFLVVWGYPTALETLWRGRTPGKAALGLRVVTTEGAPVRFRHAAIRAAFTLIDFYALGGAVAVVAVLASRRQQRLGDLVAGTLVLRERTAAPPAAPVRFTVPAGAEGYAQTVDPGGLDAGDYAAIRSFLLRTSTLEPASRTRIGLQMANRLAAKLAHRPPPDVHPEMFLVAAAARYQDRFGAPGTTLTPAASPAGAPASQEPADRDAGFAPPS